MCKKCDSNFRCETRHPLPPGLYPIRITLTELPICSPNFTDWIPWFHPSSCWQTECLPQSGLSSQGSGLRHLDSRSWVPSWWLLSSFAERPGAGGVPLPGWESSMHMVFPLRLSCSEQRTLSGYRLSSSWTLELGLSSLQPSSPQSPGSFLWLKNLYKSLVWTWAGGQENFTNECCL